MRTELINKKRISYEYNDEPAEYYDYNYYCPCGKGKIVETHDDTPGNREHLVRIICEKCSKEYKLDLSKGVRNWQLIKGDEETKLDQTKKQENWTSFLDDLKENNEFDVNLKQYLGALKYISEISIKCIDEPEERIKINQYLNSIVNFIQTYSENYYELSLIKGFKTNEEIANGKWKIDGRDYYYYIADQKMKASVYYVRYLNFLDKHMNATKKAEEQLNEIITKVKNIVEGGVDVSDKNIVGIIDELSLTREEIQELRQPCVECINQISAKDISYLKYMLFNNMIREIRYIGAAYQYLWHWEVKTKNLFRYVSYDGKEMTLGENTSKKAFLEDMFNKVISHMTKSSEELCSYSEDPYIDIFKYLKIQKNQTISETFVSQGNETIKILGLENNNTSRFEIIKGININSVYRGNEPQSFYEFVQDSRTINNGDKFAYAVELYPELPAREKNSKDTAKKIKQLLNEYLKTWMKEDEVKELGRYTADDKEVVTCGTVEKNVVDVKNEDTPQDFVDGTRYRIELSKDDLIFLLLKINENNTVEKIVEQINVDINWGYIDNWIQEVINEKKTDPYSMDGSINQQITDKKKIAITWNCNISVSFINNITNPTLSGCKKKLEETIKDKIKGYLKSRYNTIINSGHDKAKFILRFIEVEKHKCPQYISKYNQFEPDKNKEETIEFDGEIAILKHIVFKGWWNNAN